MGTFLRGRHPLSQQNAFMQGAGRLLLAPITTAMPDGVEDVLELEAGATQYDAVSGWVDAGYTKTGINITRNNTEETFDVDQVRGTIKRRPADWEMSVGTQLAEASLETFSLAWETSLTPAGLPDIASVTKGAEQLSENQLGLGAPTEYIERRLAVVFQFPDGAIRMFAFRRAVKAPQEAGLTLNKTGEQVSLPIRFNCLTDPDQPIDTQFGYMSDQIIVP